MKTPLNKKILQNHLTYAWWKYALIVLLAVVGWSLIYSMTEYRAPEEKKIILGVYAYGSDSNINPYMENVRAELLPEMEDVSAVYITPDATYGIMILQTRIAARECDVYVLPREEFQSFAAQGAFMALDTMLPETVAALEEAGISLSRGWRTAEETSEKHLYGIPCAELPAMSDMLKCDTSDMYLCVFFETGNDANVLTFTVLDGQAEINAALSAFDRQFKG